MAADIESSEKKTLPPPMGPFVTAALSTIISSVVLVILLCGMKLTLVSVLSVVIPGMTVATTLVAVSMGWIFVSIGRSKRQPRWTVATAILIAVTMFELLALTYLTEK